MNIDVQDPIKEKDVQVDSIDNATESMSFKISDEELLNIFKADFRKFEGEFQELSEIRKKNERYYRGKQIDKKKLKVGDAEIVLNRIMVAIETMTSMITATTPMPWVIVTPRNIRGRKLQNKLERHLRDEWEYIQNGQQILERMLRVYYMARYSVIKARWSEVDNDYVFELVRPERIKFALDVDHINKSPYVIETVTMSVDEAILKFPESKEFLDEIKESKGGRAEMNVHEYWGVFLNKNKMESFVMWVYKNKILGKDFNPYWNKNGANHFNKPRNPYMVMNSISTGKSPVDDFSLIEQAIPIQDAINKRKRQIDANAGMSNGVLVTSSAAMSKETFDKITFTPKEKIYLDGQEVESIDNGIRVVTGRSLDGGIFDDMLHDIKEIDNIFGTHDTTRGEGGGGEETYKGRLLLRDADYGRQDLTARAYEQVAEDMYNWMIQLMYVKYQKNKTILSTKEEVDSMETYKIEQGMVPMNEIDDTISKDDLKDYKIKVIVKKGSTKPKDPAAMQDMALMLMQVGQLDPLTFHELWNGQLPPDPRKAARRLYLWQKSPEALFPELAGADLIDYEAISHIKNINKYGYEAQDDIYNNANLNDIEQYQKHVDTHKMYMTGVEIDAEMDDYSSLEDEIKEIHREHLRLEVMRLDTLRQAILQKQEIQGGGADIQGMLKQNVPQIAPEQELPPEMSQEMMQGMPPEMPIGNEVVPEMQQAQGVPMGI